MEKQLSFSRKPIRFLVFSFTTFFTLFFLIFFSTWIFRSTPSSPNLDTETVHFDTTHSLQELSNNSSQNVLNGSVLLGTHVREDEVSSRVADDSSLGSGITVVSDEESKNSSLDGDMSLNSLDKQISVDIVNASDSSDLNNIEFVGDDSVNGSSSGLEFLKLNEEIESNSTSEKQDFRYTDVSKKHDIVEKNSKNNVCDIRKGKWVFDESYPLYRTCPFIDEGFSCEANGRMDKDYMKWRWQPRDCDVPRFNATKMLELIRGKRLVFIGDSINRNQWESMLCLLMGAVDDPKKVYETRHRRITKEKGDYSFKFEDYQCTVEYHVSHYLVHETKARIGTKRVQTLRIDTMDRGSSKWRGADILIFNTAHWWSHSKTKAGINYYQEGNLVHPQLDVTKAFKKALLTWAAWVDKYINPRKTQIFFRSASPSHFSGGQWNSGGHCKDAFQPINITSSEYHEKNSIVEETISQMKNPVTYLDITRLSDYRPDGHPSMYGRNSANRKRSIQDCSHWCLPGVPDNWNELLYYYLLSERRTNS